MELTFCFDFLSPYAYLAWTQIHPLAARHGATVRPAPVLFAALLNHHGQKGPAEIPAKRAYVFKDVVRRARLLDVPLAAPASHPFQPLLALRAVLAAPEGDRRALIDGLFAATWGRAERRGIDDPATVAHVAQAAGLDGEALVARTREPDIKDALRRATEEAVRAGVFGVPTVRVGGELFWGLDSFDLLERHLRGEGGVSDEALARFAAIPSGAER
ncbi:MAG TPA: 2-hydroxychromene-2-carboxylate isomerase [Sandaracinaceae bacterium LLY-WYZ-13_1]|nr:2-hydroxychromene-2-carboxylate isomerase [Sandaracinaceae bacterium LLY-WYZ-13_1]